MASVGIIGGGLSSLYASCVLAKAGLQVELFEKNSSIGGRSRTFQAEGFTFDMGPSWYWMPDLIDSCFEYLNEDRSKYYSLSRLEKAYQVFWKDQTNTIIPSEKNKLKSLFDSFEKNGGQKLDAFLTEAEEKYRIAKPLMQKPGEKLKEVATTEVLSNIFKMDVFKSVDKAVNNKFSSEKARSILRFPVLFLGEMPNKIPALYTLMNHADLNLGTWYPEGGMSALAKALEKIAIDNGVQIKFNSNVEQVLSSKGKVSGIKTSDGVHSFDYVISGADYHFTEQNLIPKSERRYSEAYWNKRKMAPSSLIYYLGIDKEISGLEHHNLFFDESLDEHGKTIYDNKKWPENPLFYACAPSKTDKGVAPTGKENLFLLMPLATDIDDPEEKREEYLNIMIERIEKHTGTSIKDDIIYKRSYCVSDFKNDYNSFQGNAYGLANTLNQTANLKPKMRSKLKGLFFCGQLTVPGPGVPPSLLSGKMAAELILKDYERTI